MSVIDPADWDRMPKRLSERAVCKNTIAGLGRLHGHLWLARDDMHGLDSVREKMRAAGVLIQQAQTQLREALEIMGESK